MVQMSAAVSALATWRISGEDELVYEALGQLTRDELVALSAQLTREVGWLRDSGV
jgi:hypothetical protein